MAIPPKIVLVCGIVVAAVLFIINLPFYAGIAIIITVALYLGLKMQKYGREFARTPEIYTILKEDAKGVVVKNKGEVSVYQVHVDIVPLDISFDVGTLEPGAEYEYTLAHMINEAKAVIKYRDEEGNTYTHSSPLSALGGGEEDLLKPVFPMFGWK
ncbi:MAG: hypothetical protein RQ758_07870 [Methanomicrobiaceae archaeon]|nr:hypothetical protein [Methanomicrobiaceae archaeon]